MHKRHAGFDAGALDEVRFDSSALTAAVVDAYSLRVAGFDAGALKVGFGTAVGALKRRVLT